MYVPQHSSYFKEFSFSVTMMVCFICFLCRNLTPPSSFVPITTNLTIQIVPFAALAVPGETVKETLLMSRYKCN